MRWLRLLKQPRYLLGLAVGTLYLGGVLGPQLWRRRGGLSAEVSTFMVEHGWLLGVDTLGYRVGKALHVQGIDVDEYLRKYENGGEVSAAAEINRMEFRRSVRLLVKTVGTANASEVDDLFDSFDKDGALLWTADAARPAQRSVCVSLAVRRDAEVCPKRASP